jgi:hypothetical protein
MDIAFVKFSDASESEIEMSFAGQQDPEIYEFLGEVAASDPRYLNFLSKLVIKTPTLLELAIKERDRLLGVAGLAIAPLQDALDLDKATEEERSLLTIWKEYRVALSRLDLAVVPIPWPEQPQQF